MLTILCPFCGEHASPPLCPGCGRDPAAPRRVCANCHCMTPSADAACACCGSVDCSELWWKLPAIAAMFVVAAIVASALAVLG